MGAQQGFLELNNLIANVVQSILVMDVEVQIVLDLEGPADEIQDMSGLAQSSQCLV
jgi:hypothetical protein